MKIETGPEALFQQTDWDGMSWEDILPQIRGPVAKHMVKQTQSRLLHDNRQQTTNNKQQTSGDTREEGAQTTL
jgi:hypothetical protein